MCNYPLIKYGSEIMVVSKADLMLHTRVNLPIKLIDRFKLLFEFIFFKPTEIKFTENTLIAWLVREFDNDDLLEIVFGELACSYKIQNITEKFDQAIKNNKKMEVICGPAVYEKSKSEPNTLFRLLLDYSRKGKVKLYFADSGNLPTFHFARCGDSVLIETPHLPSEGLEEEKIQIVTIENSFFWKNRTKYIFRYLKENCRDLAENSDAKVYNLEELEQYEKSTEFKEYLKKHPVLENLV